MKYFTSDMHFNHINIMKYENRPFNDVIQMNETMIKKWNSKVNPNDEVYILGDIGFCTPRQIINIFNKLNGKKYLIKGNHDKRLLKNSEVKKLFVWIKDTYMLYYDNKRIFLCHYPMVEWDCSFHGSIHLFGHVHNNPLKYQAKNSYNVGVDLHDFYPVTLEEILRK